MPIVRFLGAVLPLVSNASIGTTPQLTCTTDDGLVAEVSVGIIDAHVLVECNVNRTPTITDLDYLYIRAMDFSRAAVDILTFASGCALNVHLHTLENEGEFSALRLLDPSLALICTSYNLDAKTSEEKDGLRRIVLAVFSDPAIFMALNDLTQAIAIPHYTEINCGRVLDGLRKIMAPGLEPKQGWATMQKTLQVSEGYMEWVSKHSTNPRHGDRSPKEREILQEIAARTWRVMNRFLEYKKREDKTLPASEFPLLSA
jgi:hypothetical protein